MFDFLKKSKKDGSPVEVSQVDTEDESEFEWLVESFVQFLVSPIWKLNINSFIDENCIIFEDVEENQLDHLKIHKEFVLIAENLLGEFIGELGIIEEQAIKTIACGVNVPEYKEYFDQLFLIDNFLVFKKQMIRRNKELELEALESLKQNSGSQWVEDESQVKQTEIANLEQEKADLDYCIEMSKAQDDEMKKLADEDERLLMEAIRMSEKAFEDEQQSYCKELEEAKMMSLFEAKETEQKKMEAMLAEKPKVEEKPKAVEKPKEDQLDNSLLKNLEQEKRIMTQLIEEKPKVSSDLPPLKRQSDLPSLGPLKKAPPMCVDVTKWQEQKVEVEKKIEKIGEPEAKPDTLADRRSRLLAQRNKLLEQKKVMRENELKRYNEIKEEVKTQDAPTQPAPQNVETKKRADIYAMMKN